jgi:chromatin segregation and condensation protein Rec8/ScpA/Scc1 (kleisin family)
MGMVVTFMAVLELTRQQKIKLLLQVLKLRLLFKGLQHESFEQNNNDLSLKIFIMKFYYN